MLKRILHLFIYFFLVRDKIRHPLWPLCWMILILPTIYPHRWQISDQIRHPLWPLCWMRYYLQSILIRVQIRHRLWPLFWMGSYFQLIFIRNQIRHPFWPLCLMRYYLQLLFIRYQNPPPPLNTLLNEILPSTYLHKKIKSATPSGHFVEYDITINLSS